MDFGFMWSVSVRLAFGYCEYMFFPFSCVQVQPQPDAKMCDQTFLAITFGPCDSCSQNKPLMNIYLKNEPINYCSLCVELVCYRTLQLLQYQFHNTKLILRT